MSGSLRPSRYRRRVASTAAAALAVGVGGLAVAPRTAAAQLDWGGYVLGMGAAFGSSGPAAGGDSELLRARLIGTATRSGATLDVAYEHVVDRSSTGRGSLVTSAGATGTSDWLGADWRISSTRGTEWRHRFDRLSVGWSDPSLEVTAGRQAISWATTLFLTPADPFVPFDPSDPFRVYRAGVDAVRARVFTGPFSEIEAVVRPVETAAGTRVTALARGQTSRAGWALGAWAGAIREEVAGALFASGAIGATAVRAELSLRRADAGRTVVRAAVGADRYLTVGGRDLTLLLELQHDGFGASDELDLARVYLSEPFQAGDLQTLGRWTVAGQTAYQLHPLVSVDAMALVNVTDGSALVAPGVGWSATGAASVRLGFFYGLGDEPTTQLIPRSEYGVVPAVAYLSLTVFF